jgi:hypothetical protein
LIDGDLMGPALAKNGVKAGTARLSGGSGLVFRFDTFVCYLPPHLMGDLLANGSAHLLSGDGDRIGKAWLSPLLYHEKQELTLHVARKLYSLSWVEVRRILTNKRIEAPLFFTGQR